MYFETIVLMETFQESNQSINNDLKNLPETSVIDASQPTIQANHSTLIKLIVLLASVTVIGIVAFLFFQNQSLKARLGEPTLKLPGFRASCDYNGQTYKAGQGFMDAEGCNSCSCSENGEVACTLMACETSEMAGLASPKPVPITPDREGKYLLNSSRLDFSASFQAQEVTVTNCQGFGEGYEFWIYASDADTKVGVCSYEGPNGILFSQINDASTIECWPNNDIFEVLKVEKIINGNNIIYCQSTPKEPQIDGLGLPIDDSIVSAYIQNPSDNSAICVWMQDKSLEPIFDQILSTFEFTDSRPSSNQNAKKSLTLSGTLEELERPAPDIEYDYQLKLESPYFDELNAQGPTNITSIIVVPENETIRQTLASNVGNAVSIEGVIEWGLAETRHLKATKVSVPK